MAPVTVALAGATGLLGTPLVSALLAANHPTVVLTREGSTSTSKLPESSLVTIKPVNYKDASSITPALKGVDVVISTLASTALGDQLNLVTAAFDAGVKRFIPSEFGSDTSNPNTTDLPVYAGKVGTQKRLKELAAQNPEFTWTLVYNNVFLDSGIANGFIVNPATHSATIYDGGDVPVSVTRLSTVAKGVVGILSHLDQTKNRIVYIHDTVTTQNELVAIVKGIDGKPWDLNPVDTKQLRQDSYAELKKDKPDYGKAMVGFLPTAIYGKESGSCFEGKTDNELLGLGTMSEKEVRELVKGIVEGTAEVGKC